MAGAAYSIIVLSIFVQTLVLARTITENPILQNFEDGMKDQETFLKADLELINSTLTSKLLNLMLDGFLSLKINISESYNKSIPADNNEYNLQCVQTVESNIDINFEIDNLQKKYSSCDNLTQSYDGAIELIKATTSLTEDLDNLTNIIISEVELACQNKTGINLLKCLGKNIQNYKQRYNELYEQILLENKLVNGELLLLTVEEHNCFDQLLKEIHLFIADLDAQFEQCKNIINTGTTKEIKNPYLTIKTSSGVY